MAAIRSHRTMLCDASLPSPRRVVYRMGMPATISDWTVDMLDALPDDGQRYEIIDGELFVTPGPGEFHQDIVGALYRRLHQYLVGHGVGKTMISPSDVRRGDRKRNRVQPDVFVVRLVEGERPTYPYELHDLLLAVEVASPSNPILDYQVKRDLYLREGVASTGSSIPTRVTSHGGGAATIRATSSARRSSGISKACRPRSYWILLSSSPTRFPERSR